MGRNLEPRASSSCRVHPQRFTTNMKTSRWGNLALALFLVAGLRTVCPSQWSCEVHTTNAIPSVCDGNIYLLNCQSQYDSVVWSNGNVGYACSGPPGSYSFEAWMNGAVVFSGTRTIQSLGWQFDPVVGYPTLDGGYWIMGGAYVPFCGTSAYIAPCCMPQPADVELYLVQDGLNEIQDPCVQCHDHPCYGATVIFTEVPCGHEYYIRLVDAACAGQVDDTLHTIIVHNNANLILDTAVTGSVPGFNTGSIELLEAVPDTTELFPIYGPVTGTAVLYEGLSSSNIVAQYPGVTDAIWTDLDTGYYRVCFAPDSGCQVICDTLYVPAVQGNGVSESASMDALSLVPTATTGMLTLRSWNGLAVADITITDALGRDVSRMRMAPGPFSVEHFPRGIYVLTAVQVNERLRVLFLRE